MKVFTTHLDQITLNEEDFFQRNLENKIEELRFCYRPENAKEKKK